MAYLNLKKTILFCVISIIALTVTAGFRMWPLNELPALQSNVLFSYEIKIGSIQIMTIKATNINDNPAILDSIDIDESFLDGFEIVEIIPEPILCSRLPIVKQRSWSFEKVIPPQSTLFVYFTLRAIEKGKFSGNIDICDPAQDFETIFKDVYVK